MNLEGPDVLLMPNAFSTLSLVLHELTTNSAKYGALADSEGQITIGTRETDANELAPG